SGNSYPTGLDFSRVPTIKSLRGLVFHDIEKPNNGSRKIKRLNFLSPRHLIHLLKICYSAKSASWC
ncbi:hypothetical protein, partial [Mycoplasmopsis bovis]|uniref:hypothetical protein n=1 Tax=Mycoplasmopsis bovis TaxID=28903 RepID=UPI003D26F433